MYQNNQSLKSGQDSPVRETELSKVCGRLRSSVDMLETNLIDLQAKLGGVLSGEPISASDKTAIPEFSTTLGKELSLLAGRINEAIDFIQQLKNRLEV